MTRYICERCGGTGRQPEGCYSLETRRYDAPAGVCTTCDGEGFLGVIERIEPLTGGKTMRKFDEHGLEYEIVAELPDGLVVRPVYEDGEEYLGSCGFVEGPLYDEPPTQKRHELIAAMNKEVAELRQQRSELTDEVDRMLSESGNLLGRLQQHKQLQFIADFLDGKITHFVVKRSWSPTLLSFDEAMRNDLFMGHREPGYKLLTLFGRSKGDLAWRINHYSDGSGGTTQVVPCTSREHAEEVFREVIAEHEASDNTPNREWIKAAEAAGLSMSAGYIAKVEAAEAAAKHEEIEGLRARLAKLEENA